MSQEMGLQPMWVGVLSSLFTHVSFTSLPPTSYRTAAVAPPASGQGHIHFPREPPALKTAVLQDNGTRNDGPVLLRSIPVSEIIFCRKCFDRVNYKALLQGGPRKVAFGVLIMLFFDLMIIMWEQSVKVL